MHAYCVANRPHLLAAARDLDMIAENIVREGLNVHGIPALDFFQDVRNQVAQSLKSGIEASSSAQEAISAPSLGVSRLQNSARSLPNMPSVESSQPQVGERSTAVGHGTSGPEVDDTTSTGTMSSTMYSATPNFLATSQNTGSGQMVLPQWRQFGGSSWMRQPIPSDLALDNMYNVNLDSLQRQGMSITDVSGSFPAQEWFDELCGDEGFLGGIGQ